MWPTLDRMSTVWSDNCARKQNHCWTLPATNQASCSLSHERMVVNIKQFSFLGPSIFADSLDCKLWHEPPVGVGNGLHQLMSFSFPTLHNQPMKRLGNQSTSYSNTNQTNTRQYKKTACFPKQYAMQFYNGSAHRNKSSTTGRVTTALKMVISLQRGMTYARSARNA